MRKPISTFTHGVIDYVTAGTLFAMPAILGFGERLSRAVRMIALKKLTVAAMTNHELGIVKLIPMKTHLALDAVTGATLCTLPFLLEDEDNEDDTKARAALVTMGMMEIAYVPLTETEPRSRRRLTDTSWGGEHSRRGSRRSGMRRQTVNA
jgi:hypothetical protein